MRGRKGILILVIPSLCLCLLICLLAWAWYPTGPKRAAGPLVTIRSPHNGEQVRVGEVVNVHSTCRDDVNKVAKVELWVDGELIEVDTYPQEASLFTVVQGWQALSPGSHDIVVRAFNKADVPGQATIGVEAVEVPPEVVAEREPLPLPGELPPVEEMIERGEVPPGADVSSPPGGLSYAEEIPPTVEIPVEEAPIPPDPDPGPPPEDLGDAVIDGALQLIDRFGPFFIPTPPVAPTLVVFEALEFAVDEDYDDIYCYVSLADEPVERVPESGFFRPLGERRWDIAEYLGGENSRVIEVPPSTPLRVFVECYGWVGDAWEYLGLVDVLHPPEDWDGHTIRVHGTGSGGFDLDYRIDPLPSIIPAPYNLVYATLGNRSYLNWRWDGNEAEIDGFRLYMNDNLIASPGADFRSLEVSTWTTEHCGETNEFYVTAYRGGFGEGIESPPSNLVAFQRPPCEEPDDILYIAELPTYICGGIREIDVGYRYGSDHGDQVWIGAWPIGEGGTPFGGCSKDVIGHGEGVARMYLQYPGGGRVESSHLLVEMWDLEGNIFYSEVVYAPMVWNEDRPDLFISGADMDCYGLSRRVVIENGGCAPVETDELYLDFDSLDGEHHVGSIPISISLGPGQKYEWRYLIGVPPGTEEEFRRECQDRWGRGFEVMVDPDNQITEADEENNRYAVVASGDLRINSIEPVQVVYGAPLVKNKATAFRVKVNSSFPYAVDTKFRLELPDAQWDTQPPATGGVEIALPPGWEYPEVWGPTTIPAGATDYEVMLPIIPEEQRKEEFHYTRNPAGIIRGREVAGVYGPDVRVVPRPVADSVEFTVEIDPDGEIAELSEGNNRWVSPDYEVVTTKRLRIYYVLQIKDSSEDYLLHCPGSNIDCSGPPDNPCSVLTCTGGYRSLDDVCDELKEFAKGTTEYLLAVTPVSDSKIEYTVDCNVKYRADYTDFMGAMLDLAKENDFDYVLAVQPWGCCGVCSHSDGCYIELYGTAVNGAHELLGHGIQSIGYECYSCAPYDCPGSCPAWTCPSNTFSSACPAVSTEACSLCPSECCPCSQCTDVSCNACMASEGFWVNEWVGYESGERGVHGPTFYMDSVGEITDRWTRLDSPWRESDGALLPGGYPGLIELLRDEGDPKVLLVRGVIYKDGSVKLEPFTILESGPIDIEPGEEGDYYIVLTDSQQKILSETGFKVSFYEFRPEGRVELDQAPFVYRIEWKEGTRRIELQDKDGKVLASRDVSLNKPEVKVISPNGGEVWGTDKTYKIRWEASDADGDALVYSLAISMDGGKNWLPIAIDVQVNEYELNTVALGEGDKYLIRVRATDGVNTAEDISDAAFSIGVRRFPTRYLIGGALLLLAIGLALGVLAIAVWARKPRRL